MEVSIIIPTMGKRPQFLKEAISSAKGQMKAPAYEIMVVGPSGGQSLNICQAMGVRFLANDHGSTTLGANINYALIVANGKYYKILPDDDKLPRMCLYDLYWRAE
jgi:glycosyltransferase involved in cell wall biosynthesis